MEFIKKGLTLFDYVTMIDLDGYIESVADGQSIEELRHGMETAKVIRVGDWIYKLRCSNIDVARIELHNKYFGDTTGYEILDDAEWHGITGMLLRQPYIDIVPNSNAEGQRLLAEDLLGKYGRVLVTEDEMWADGTLFDNLGYDNVGINRLNGNYAVVDCLVSKWAEDDVRDLWGKCEYRIMEYRRW